jgi:hypothetical protein
MVLRLGAAEKARRRIVAPCVVKYVTAMIIDGSFLAAANARIGDYMLKGEE